MDRRLGRTLNPETRSGPPWRPRGKCMVPLGDSHSNATLKSWHLWEINLRFALNSTPGWTVKPPKMFCARNSPKLKYWTETHPENRNQVWNSETQNKVFRPRFYMQTFIIHKLDFNQNYYTFTLILLKTVVLCGKFLELSL